MAMTATDFPFCQKLLRTMRRKSRGKDINEIIEKWLKPRLELECQRLDLPESFISSVQGIYPRLFHYSSLCKPVQQNGKVIAVTIHIGSDNRSQWTALMHFWHELRHAKDYYEGKPPSEAKAYFYMLRRCFVELLAKASPWQLIHRSKT